MILWPVRSVVGDRVRQLPRILVGVCLLANVALQPGQTVALNRGLVRRT